MDGILRIDVRAALQGAKVGRPSEPIAADELLPPAASRTLAKPHEPTTNYTTQFWGEGAGQ